MFTFLASDAANVPFETTPKAIEYGSCGTDKELIWKYDSARIFQKKTWYIIEDSGIKEQIAFISNSTFTVNRGALYPPASEGRLQFVENAGIKISNLKNGDEGIIRVEVDYDNLDFSTGETQLKVYAFPQIVSPYLSNPTSATLGNLSKTFICNISSSPAATIKWYKDGIELINGTTGNITQNLYTANRIAGCSVNVVESTLSIFNIAVSHAGNITCSAVATTDTDLVFNQSTLLIVEYAPGAVNQTQLLLTPSSIKAGDATVISCLAYSIPDPSYEIWRGGVMLASGLPASGVPFTYTTNPLSFYDDGNYTCKATNIHGNNIKNIALNITVKPEIWYMDSEPVELNIGDNAMVTCGIHGDPLLESNLNWTKIQGGSSSFNQQTVLHYSNTSITYRNHSLSITSATKNDYGKYRCYGWNDLGVASRDITVYIKCPATISSSNLLYPSEEVSEYEVKEFTCTADGYPKPVITWKNDGVAIPVTSAVTATNDSIWHVTSTISVNLTSTYAGIVECFASNGISPDASNTTNLLLKYQPVPTLTAIDMRIFEVSGNRKFTTAIGDTIVLFCTANGYPKPTLTWFKGGEDITPIVTTNENKTEVENTHSWTVTTWISITSIKKDNNNDLYKCKASNDVGSSSSSLTVLVLNGEFTAVPVDPLCSIVGSDIYFDWQYTYTQPIDFIKWERHTDANFSVVQTIGRLNNVINGGYDNVMEEPRYVYNASTLSGLTIKAVSIADEGWYGIKINFQNSPDVLSRSVYLLVITNPHDTKIIPVEAAVSENNNVSLTCTTTSKPAASVEWYRDYNYLSRINNSTNYAITQREVEIVANESVIESTLVIINSQLKDIGNYTCKAVGKIGFQYAHSELTVHYAPKNTTLVASSNPVIEGQSVYLTCTAVAKPTTINYQIYLNDAVVHNSTNGTMVINPVMNYHEGNYICVPINTVGADGNASLLLNVSVPPVLMEHNNPVTVTESSNADMLCKVYGDPQPTVYWSKISGGSENDISIGNYFTSNSTLFVVNSTATSLSVSRQDAGVYNCYANNSLGAVSQNITVVVHYAVNITSHTLVQPSENLTEGVSFVRECIATGFPKPIEIVWKLNSAPITRHPISKVLLLEGVDFATYKSTITIAMVDKDDAGVLECFAKNVVGNDSETTNVYVKYPPTLTGKPDPTEYVNLGASLTLSCVATSNELATIQWYKDNVKVFHGDGIHEITVSSNSPIDQVTSTIKVNPVILDTLGAYTCNATNSLGFEKFTTNVVVYYPATIKSYPPATISASEFQTNYTIQCIAIGNPQPVVTWCKNDTEMTFPQLGYTLTETYHNDTTVSKTLTINMVGLADYGNWTCKAKNTIAGNLIASDDATTLLTISYDPTFVPTFPVMQYRVNETEKVTLSCRVKSYPKPFVWWDVPAGITADGRFSSQTTTVFQSTEYSIVESNLTITNAAKSDYGNFVCYGNNTFTSINKSSELIVQYQATPNTTQTLTLTEGIDSLFLQTIATSNPASNFTYHFNNSVITSGHVLAEYVNSSSNSATVQTSILSSATVDSTNGGFYHIYTCNFVGCKTDEWKVIVKYKPVLLNPVPSTEHVNATNTHALTCRFKGNPLPIITWERGDISLSGGGNIAISSTNLQTGEFDSEVVSTISITNILSNQGGIYTCSATNEVGTTQASTNLTVCHAPVIEKDLVNEIIRITEGTLLTLDFQVYSYPGANFTWRKDNLSPLNNPPQTTVTNTQKVDFFTVNQSSVISTSALTHMSGQYNVTACNFLGCVNSQTKTVIVEYPPVHEPINDVDVVQNQTATFTCAVSSEPVSTITWFLNGTTPVTDGGDHSITEASTTNTWNSTVSSVLTISNVQRAEDAGVYTCRAMNSVGTKDESANLTVQYPPIEVTGLLNITINEGQPLNLVYDVRSLPESTFTWQHNSTTVDSKYIESSNDIYRGVFDVYKRAMLHLEGSKVTKDQAGFYTVTATNSLGEDINSTACVVVNYAPIVTSKFHSRTNVTKGTSPSLTCDIDSFPVSTVQWYKNGVLLPTSPSDYAITTGTLEASKFGAHIQSNLTFTSVDKTDSNNYTCKATNTLGTAEDKTYMIVLYPPVVLPDFNPTLFNATEHTLSSLVCNVDSNPVSTILWLYSEDGTTYNPLTGDITIKYLPTQYREHEVLFDSTLQFLPNKIEVTDAGYYRCKATNQLGSTQRDTQINVQYAPKFIDPGLMSGHENITVGSTKSFKCHFKSNPGATVQWLKDGVVITSGYTTSVLSTVDQTVTVESDLTLTNIAKSDLANYTCQASNGIGTSHQSKVLNVLYPPTTTAVSRNFTLSQGETLTLDCSNEANPPSAHTWTKDDASMNYIGVTYVTSTVVATEGKYVCTPSNGLGSGNPVTYFVKIKIPPSITADAVCSKVPQPTGDPISMCTCLGTGYPLPDIFWTKYPRNVVLSNTSVLRLPVIIANDGSYVCHVRNDVGEVTSTAMLDIFGPLTGTWTVWSGCNNSCGAGSHFRTRQCSVTVCADSLIEWDTCVGACQLKPIPIVHGEDDDWYIALYVLVPLAVVLLVLGGLWLARLNRKQDDDPVIIPINPNIGGPPGMPQHIFPAGMLNNGFVPTEPEMESVEVNLLFDDDNEESETDILDLPEEETSDPGSPNSSIPDSEPGTPNFASDYNNFYEELPSEYDFRASED